MAHLQAAAVIDCGLQGYPRDKDAIVPVDAVSFPYVEPQRLTRPFDYLHKVDRVLRVLEQQGGGDTVDIPQRYEPRE